MPHYQPQLATYHIVFRLKGSMNLSSVRDALSRSHPKYLEEFDTSLNHASIGPKWLEHPEVAAIVKEAIHNRDSETYNLLTYCIMPNHVHMIFELIDTNKEPDDHEKGRVSDSPYKDVSRFAESTESNRGRDDGSTYRVTNILASMKKYTALRANRILRRTGAFWQHESYDHVIRDDEELENAIWYVLYNPVKAGFVQDWERWQWSYCKKEYAQ